MEGAPKNENIKTDIDSQESKKPMTIEQIKNKLSILNEMLNSNYLDSLKQEDLKCEIHLYEDEDPYYGMSYGDSSELAVFYYNGKIQEFLINLDESSRPTPEVFFKKNNGKAISHEEFILLDKSVSESHKSLEKAFFKKRNGELITDEELFLLKESIKERMLEMKEMYENNIRLNKE